MPPFQPHPRAPHIMYRMILMPDGRHKLEAYCSHCRDQFQWMCFRGHRVASDRINFYAFHHRCGAPAVVPQ